MYPLVQTGCTPDARPIAYLTGVPLPHMNTASGGMPVHAPEDRSRRFGPAAEHNDAGFPGSGAAVPIGATPTALICPAAKPPTPISG